MGIVPYGSGSEMSQNPVGSGPFRFVSAEQDKDVVIERNDNYWGDKAKALAGAFYGGAGRHHARARTAQRQRRCGHQLAAV